MTVLKCISPIDGSVFAERPVASMSVAQKMVAAARKAQKGWADRPLDERISLVRAGVARLGEMNDEIVPEIARMMGRPVRFGGEFGGVNERASYMAEIAKDALKPIVIEASDKFERRIEREPQGVVLVIAPWNYPYLTAINTVAPALIAGNAVIIKHATQTLLAGERLVSAFVEAGVPADVFQNVFLDHQTTSDLIAAKSFNFVNFTGSVGGGRAMEHAAAGTFTGLGLELGGKDPGYVMEDADIGAAVDTLIDGAMFNSGQCCCGIERIYVVDSLFDEFVTRAATIVSGYVLGNPLDKATTLGPMANVRFAKLLREQIAEATAKGAVAHIDTSGFADDGGTYLAPQILTNVTHDMSVMREESFGPVVGIMKVKDDAEAVRLMNDSDFGLTASLWTNDAERAARLGRDIETGTVFMNRCDYPRSCLVLDRLQGYWSRWRLVFHRLSQSNPAQIISSQKDTSMSLTANWSYPTAIRFGAGRIAEIGEACAAAGIRKPLFVTDRGLSVLPIATATLDLMDKAGLGRAMFADVDPNPNENNLAAGIEVYKAGGHDGVIAFGGGSGLDLGKMVAFMAGQTRPLWDFEDIGDWWTRADADAIAPIIAVPTTAGTGSEVGRASVITNSKTHIKKIIFHPKVMPTIVICDPELTVGMPPAITAGTGMDAFAHCLEAYSSPFFHPMSQGIALEGMRLVKEYLPRAYHDGKDMEARAQMMVAAAMGATAFQKGLGAVHALSHPVGAVYNTHHGTTNAVCIPAVLKLNRPEIESRIEAAAAYLGLSGGFDGFCEFVDQLNTELKIPKRLADMGVGNDRIDEMTAMALEDPSAGGNPVKLTIANVKALFEACI